MSHQDDKNALREDLLVEDADEGRKKAIHKRRMCTDKAYFTDWTVKYYFIKEPQHLFDAFLELHKWCVKHKNIATPLDILKDMEI